MSVVAAPYEFPRTAFSEEDRHFLLHGVSWSTYERLREELGDGLHLTYLNGTLELMSPSFPHEHAKKLIARLLEAWALESRVPLNGYGNVTLKRAGERALEPDECYCIGNVEQTPDLAIEVVVSKGYVDKIAVYQSLGVREIWTWQEGSIAVLELLGDRYVLRADSKVLPGLDLALLSAHVVPEADQTEQVLAYLAALRARGARG